MEMKLRERAALVALLQQPHARWQEVALDVLEAGNAVELLQARLGLAETLFPDTTAVEAAIEAAAADLAGWAASDTAFHAFFDDSYPAQLRDIHQMPPILFTRGILRDDRRAVAVVGTRQASEHGLKIASAVATALACNDITVVSGLAKGIDTAAHRAALAVGGRTVAVIGTGINRAYPAENALLQQAIAHEGLIISQFWPDAPPTKQSFPMRNAVMSGYAAATVVVEAPWKSGARIQARLALEHGRPVIMPRELLEHDWAREYAQRPGVHVVVGLEEILEVVDRIIGQTIITPDALPEASPLVWI
jgi:DNA processing protein